METSVLLAQLLAEDRFPPAALWERPLISSRLATIAGERVARPECEDDFRRTGTAPKP